MCEIMRFMNTISFEQAIATLQALEILIYPTETFYAVGGSALSAKAVAGVYSAKERDKHLPLPVIIGDLSQLSLLTDKIDGDVESIIGKFWPGPLTIVLPARPELPPLLTAGTGRVAVRFSSHFEASRLAQAAGFPLISSSANLSGQNPVTRTEDLDVALVHAARGAVYTGGTEPRGGAPSTIIELVEVAGGGKMLHILREGAIPAADFIKLGFACYIS